MMSAAAFTQMLGSLLAVVVLILVVAAVLRRMPGAGLGRSGALKLRASLSLGTRERIVMVDAGDKTLVLGVAPGRVNTLHVMDVLPEDEVEPVRFRELMKRKSA